MISEENLAEFLQSEINSALQQKKPDFRLTAGERESIQYIVGVLVYFLRGENWQDIYTDTPLVFLQTFPPNPFVLKKFADFCLFHAGFFPLHFSRHLPPRRNFIQAGQCAYADLSRQRKKEIFHLLARNFVPLANLISEVKMINLSAKDLQDLCDLWRATGSSWAKKILLEQGIVPFKSG